jgi:translation initiation factor IF-2
VPARIYALAKELNLDSKDLVDIVKKVGITGKGSALASLTDEETQKVRDHLSAASPTSAPAPAKPGVAAKPGLAAEPAAPIGAVRDSVVPSVRKPMAIQVGRTAKRKADEPETAPPAQEQPAADSSATTKVVESTPAKETKPKEEIEIPTPKTTSSHPIVAESKPESAPVLKGTMAGRIASRMAARKPTPLGGDANAAVRSEGGMTGGKVRSFDGQRSGGNASAGGSVADAQKNRANRTPRINVKMASLPEMTDQKAPASASNEPKAQKPDVRLSADAIAGAKQGMNASLDQIVREEREKKRGGPPAPSVKRSPGGLSGFTDREKAAREEEEDRLAPNEAAAPLDVESLWTVAQVPAPKIVDPVGESTNAKASTRPRPEKRQPHWYFRQPFVRFRKRPEYRSDECSERS